MKENNISSTRKIMGTTDFKLTKTPIRISVKELVDEKRIELIIRAFNVALKESGCGWLKARVNHPIKDYLSFDIWKVDKSRRHLV